MWAGLKKNFGVVLKKDFVAGFKKDFGAGLKKDLEDASFKKDFGEGSKKNFGAGLKELWSRVVDWWELRSWVKYKGYRITVEKKGRK